jgi:MHS family proline/betaine transporter-like MFS transporter
MLYHVELRDVGDVEPAEASVCGVRTKRMGEESAVTENVDSRLPDRRAGHRVLIASLIGNFMEWYDFAVYGFFAVVIGSVFFPSESATVELLSSLAVFGVAFFFRPVGGFLFGAIGDRYGRRVSLSAAIILMSVATTLIALLPSYATFGLLAPILLVTLRSLQGVSVGGEWTGASAFIVEYASDARRGRWGSLISTTAALGVIFGSTLALILQTNLSAAAMESWGWRVPFLIAAPLGAAGLYLRLRLDDTPVYRTIQRQNRVTTTPIRRAFRESPGAILLTFAFSGVSATGFYYLVTYMVNFLSETAGYPRTDAIFISLIGLVVYASLCPLAGLLSDYIGRRWVLLIGCAGHAILALPIFFLLGSGAVPLAVLGLCLYTVSQSMLNVMNSVILIELFEAETRMTAASIGYNLGAGPVAGSGPVLAGTLVAATGSAFAPAWYLIAIAAAGGLALWLFLPETRGVSLTAPATADESAMPASPATTGYGHRGAGSSDS